MAEAREKQEKVKDTMAVLDWQKNTRQVQRSQEGDLVKREQEMLRQQWAIEEQKEKTDADQRFMLHRERNLELIAHNATEKQLREQAGQLERNKDKVLLNAALQKETAIEQIEAEERLARRREIQELQAHYNNVQSDKAAYERRIDQLTQEENEKQWNNREQQWRREDQARVNLLKNVYQNREQDILLKQTMKKETEWLRQNDKQQIDNEIDRQNRMHEEHALKQAIDKKTHQTDVLRQVGERDRTMRRDLQDRMYEERAAKLAEIEYQRRIQGEQQNNDGLLQTWKSTV